MKPIALFLLFILGLTVRTVTASDGLVVLRDPALGAVSRVHIYQGGEYIGDCSGVLISARAVLTVRHCLEFAVAEAVTLGRGSRAERIVVDRISTQDLPRALYNMFTSTGNASAKLRENHLELIAKDLAILHLAHEAITSPLKVLPMGYQDELDKLSYFVAGYPSQSRLMADSALGHKLAEPVSRLSSCFADFSVVLDTSEENPRYQAGMSQRASRRWPPTEHTARNKWFPGATDKQLKQTPWLKTDCLITEGYSGGPLLTQVHDQYFIVGIVSTGRANAQESLLGRNDATAHMVNLLNPDIRTWVDLFAIEK